MAFFSSTDELGRKTFHPTKELDALLKQDRITDVDLRQFRSSNKVEHLLKSVLKNRGFERQEWMRQWARETSPKAAKPKKSLISHFTDMLKSAPKAEPGKVWMLPPTVSVAERVNQAVHAFILEHAREPNKLWISNKDWYELTYKATPYYAGPAAIPENGNATYQGMLVQLLAHGSELFVGLAASGAPDPKGKLKGLHSFHVSSGNRGGKTAALKALEGLNFGDHVTFYDPEKDKQMATVQLPKSSNIEVGQSITVPWSEGVNRVGTVKKITTESNDAIMAEIQFYQAVLDAIKAEDAIMVEPMKPFEWADIPLDSLLGTIHKSKPKAKAKTKAVPKPVKRIIPPSQMKRKLAL